MISCFSGRGEGRGWETVNLGFGKLGGRWRAVLRATVFGGRGEVGALQRMRNSVLVLGNFGWWGGDGDFFFGGRWSWRSWG